MDAHVLGYSNFHALLDWSTVQNAQVDVTVSVSVSVNEGQ